MTDLEVVMLVANDVTNDSRVRKEAAAVAATGALVTVLGVSPDGNRSMELMDGVLVVRLAVDFRLREERRRRRKARREWRPPLLRHPSRASRVARSRTIDARLGEVKSDSGHALRDAGSVRYRLGVVSRRIRQVRWRVARVLARVRGALTFRLDRVFVFGWRVWDAVVSRTTWPARWRLVHPEAYDYEFAFGDVIDRLQPDVVHAHDMHMIGVAVRAAGRAMLRGRSLRTVYDAHEYVPGIARYGPRTPRFIAAWARHEKEYIRRVDRVVTVSPAIADRLFTEHRLHHQPSVILNAASAASAVSSGDAASSGDAVSSGDEGALATECFLDDIRSRVGLVSGVPLLVYSGGITAVRGIETVIEALPHLAGVHLAVVAVPHAGVPAVGVLRSLAGAVGVADRVHFTDPVGPGQVVPFLSTADIGLIPMLHAPNHDMAMPNKLFEYSLAGLPLVVSNMRSLAGHVTGHGIGEAFEVGNPVDLADKVRKILDAPKAYRERLARPEIRSASSWPSQAEKLRSLYAELLDQPLSLIDEPDSSRPTRPRLLIGPSNSAGQAWHWSRAVERHAAPATARSLMTADKGFGFSAHYTAGYREYRDDVRWQFGFASMVLREFTHVLFEAGRPFFGQRPGQLFVKDLPTLESAGIAHGVVFHGSEVRDPRRHRERYPYSPFKDSDELTERLQRATDLIRQHLVDYDGKRFVTTPDLLEYVENAEWLPVVVDPDEFASPHPVLGRRIPVVLHAPSNSSLKGSAYIDPVLQDLAARRLIEYRRVEGMPQAELKELVKESDIVVDQLMLGSYGVFACEAMAAGRVTIGHVADHVRDLLPTELPIVEANPDTFGEVIERVVAERDPAVKAAAAGPDYVRRLHDGRESARALQNFLSPELTL